MKKVIGFLYIIKKYKNKEKLHTSGRWRGGEASGGKSRKARSKKKLAAFDIHPIGSDGTNLVDEPILKDFSLSAGALN